MLGAIIMIVVGQFYGFYDSAMAVRAVDWNVVFLLGCRMAIVSVMIPTGAPEPSTTTTEPIDSERIRSATLRALASVPTVTTSFA